MFRKLIIALVLCLAFLLIVSNLVLAGGSNGPASQMDMGTPTPLPQALSTPLGELPLSGSTVQTGTCPMLSGDASMSGMSMGGMSGMSDMSMSGGMSGMSMGGGMSGMTMGGMSGMDMSSMSGMSAVPYPWYSNPWWLLGWVLLTVLVGAILAVAVYGVIQLTRRNKTVSSAAAS